MENKLFCGKKVLITAGPTREAIDPVRYISNHSSGKMGYAIAEIFLKHGALVTLVSGPVCLSLSHPNLKMHNVNSAEEMFVACQLEFDTTDIAIFSAAVADYRPAIIEKQKIKKDGFDFSIKMIRNVDIAYEFGKLKKYNQLSVGFALETNDEESNAYGKLQKKNLDMVVLNSMNDKNATFGYDTNKITVIRSDFSKTDYSLKQKKRVAEDILLEVNHMMILKQLATAG